MEVHQVQESGLLLGRRVGWESALDSCPEGIHCEILNLEVLLSLLRTSVRPACLGQKLTIKQQRKHSGKFINGFKQQMCWFVCELVSLFRDCISNWLSDCLLQGVTIGFCPCRSRLDSRSISFLEEESEPTQTRANLWSTERSLFDSDGPDSGYSRVHLYIYKDLENKHLPFWLAICSILKKLDLQHIINAYWANSVGQIFISGPLSIWKQMLVLYIERERERQREWEQPSCNCFGNTNV